MKKLLISIIFVFSPFVLSAQDVESRLALPSLTFDNPNLQRLASRAEAQYNDPDDGNIFEVPEKWEGKEWQLAILNYFTAVATCKEVVNSEGEPTESASGAEVEIVRSAMFDKYLAAIMKPLPKSQPARLDALDERVGELLENMEFLTEGTMYEINAYASYEADLRMYVAQRFAREEYAKVGNESLKDLLMEEEVLFRQYSAALTELYYNYHLCVSGWGVYYSMLPLETGTFWASVEEERVESLKRASALLGLTTYEDVEALEDELDEGLTAKYEGALMDFMQNISNEEIDEEVRKETNESLQRALSVFSEFSDKRNEIVEQLPVAHQKDYKMDSLHYFHVLIGVLNGDFDEGYEEEGEDAVE